MGICCEAENSAVGPLNGNGDSREQKKPFKSINRYNRESNRSSSHNLIGWQSKKGLQKVDDISQHYTWTKKLGAGAFGVVYEAYNVRAEENLSKCAVKIIEKSTIEAHQNRENLNALLKSELNMLQNLVHPHIVHVLELLEDENNLYFAMELIENGNLMDVLDEISTNNYNFTAADAAGLILQILSALNYMH